MVPSKRGKKNEQNKDKNMSITSTLEKEIALVKSRLLPDHPLNRPHISSSNTMDTGKGVTQKEDSGST